MSTPHIPGYTTAMHRRTLATEWQRPSGDFPPELWPLNELQRIMPEPTDWVVVEEHFFTEEKHGGTSSILVGIDQTEAALQSDSWSGRHLGDVSIWDDSRFEDGLTASEGELNVEFLCQVRQHHGLRRPSVEISLPFVWYWDAIRDGDNWFYLNSAGWDEPLIRAEVGEDSWQLEIRALELRQYLAARELALLVQHDFVPTTEKTDFARIDAEHRDDWCFFSWVCTSEPSMGSRPGFARLLGKHVVLPMRGPRRPRWDEGQDELEYPKFQHGIDAQSGQPLRHTCDPDQLGTYFDPDNSRLHYLTPVNFKRAVLSRYTSEPSRFRVSATRLECLDLWGLDISTNTAGLIEVYLGDLGRDLPSDEWPHWLGYNVAPAGRMREDRFRRDFLNQPSASNDVPAALRQARQKAAQASTGPLGVPLWKPLRDPERTEFDRMHAPTSTEPRSLNALVLTMTKALVDSIDPQPIRKFLGAQTKEDGSLALLEKLVSRLGGSGEMTQPLKDLQGLRSRGGIAHLGGRDADKAVAQMEITGMSPEAAFNKICHRLTVALEAMAALFAQGRGGSA
jgi:hypothetical protein